MPFARRSIYIEFSLPLFRLARFVFYLEFAPPSTGPLAAGAPGCGPDAGARYTVLILAFSTVFQISAGAQSPPQASTQLSILGIGRVELAGLGAWS